MDMEETFLGTVLIIVVLVLLILDIVICVMVIRLLKTLRRAANFLDSIVDDAEKIAKVVRGIRVSSGVARAFKKIAAFLPGGSDEDKGKDGR